MRSCDKYRKRLENIHPCISYHRFSCAQCRGGCWTLFQLSSTLDELPVYTQKDRPVFTLVLKTAVLNKNCEWTQWDHILQLAEALWSDRSRCVRGWFSFLMVLKQMQPHLKLKHINWFFPASPQSQIHPPPHVSSLYCDSPIAPPSCHISPLSPLLSSLLIILCTIRSSKINVSPSYGGFSVLLTPAVFLYSLPVCHITVKEESTLWQQPQAAALVRLTVLCLPACINMQEDI